MNKVKKIAIFVDVQNIYYTIRQAYGRQFNYRELWQCISSEGEIVSAMDGMYAGFTGAKNRPNQIAATLTERQRYCWFEGRHWTEMSEKLGKFR